MSFKRKSNSVSFLIFLRFINVKIVKCIIEMYTTQCTNFVFNFRVKLRVTYFTDTYWYIIGYWSFGFTSDDAISKLI